MKLSLQSIATLIEANTDVKARVEETWIDYGAGIKQDQVLVKKGEDRDWVQLLSPRELEEVELEMYTFDELQEHIDILNGVKKPFWDVL